MWAFFILNMVGIGITTHNRYDTFKRCYESILKHSKGCKIIVVDDASKIPVPEVTYRFEQNAGIARAKNKCFELLEDCEDIFLFDDDVEVLKKGWQKPYMESGENHLMYIFTDFPHGPKLNDTSTLYQSDKITAYSHPRGCVLYFKRVCLEKVGGMDPIFGRWGWEHPELSDRIFAAGLTTFPYADVTGSAQYFHSLDEYKEIISTVWDRDRMLCIQRNREIYKQLKGRTDYVPYKESSTILTYFGNGVKDNQRGTVWEADKSLMSELFACGLPITVLNNCFKDGKEGNVTYVRAESIINPNIQRWVSYYKYLQSHYHDFVFCVDATDVACLNSPFGKMERGKLYVGSERERVGCPWMRNHAGWNPVMKQWVRRNAQDILLNAGLVGGDYNTIMRFLRDIIRVWSDNRGNIGDTDMIPFNMVCKNFKIVTGKQVHTVFKAYEKSSPGTWFRHK